MSGYNPEPIWVNADDWTTLFLREIQGVKMNHSPGRFQGRLSMRKKPKKTLPGKVEKIIKSPLPDEPEKAQIEVDGADELYKEIRIENKLTDEKGDDVQLKQDADVDVTVEAEPDATTPKGKTEKAKGAS
jgi:hypothetical protein